MECNIYDSTLTKIGVIVSFISMTWTEQYSDIGAFNLVVYKDEENLELLKEGNFVAVRPYDTLMYIYSVEDKKNQLWIYGAESKYLLKRRIYNGTLTCNNIESTLKQAVLDKRPFSFVDVAESRGLTARTDAQRSYTSLFDISKSWCDRAEYGFRFVHDKANKKLLYDVYNGEIRENAVFSEKYGNLFNLKRTSSKKNWANVAYVAGAGEGETRIVVECGAVDAENVNRSEIYIDARDLVLEEGQTQGEYEALLVNRGLEKLLNYALIEELTFEVDSSGFGVDFKLGDMIRCFLPEYKATFYIRISGFSAVYENNKQKIKLQLGNPILRSET